MRKLVGVPIKKQVVSVLSFFTAALSFLHLWQLEVQKKWLTSSSVSLQSCVYYSFEW